MANHWKAYPIIMMHASGFLDGDDRGNLYHIAPAISISLMNSFTIYICVCVCVCVCVHLYHIAMWL